MLVFTGTDRLFHFLWDAYENENHKYHSAFLEHFRQIDEVIGEIANEISDDDVLIILSDHGFELLEKEVNVNFLLKENGFLSLSPESKRNFADIDNKTKAFALEPARIYINGGNKYPRGSVRESEYEPIIEDIIEIFNDLESDGRKVIKKIFRKEDIYKGPFTNQAPDIVLLPNSGFNLKASIKANVLYERSIFTGKHTQQDAFILVNNCYEEEIITEKPSVSDALDILN